MLAFWRRSVDLCFLLTGYNKGYNVFPVIFDIFSFRILQPLFSAMDCVVSADKENRPFFCTPENLAQVFIYGFCSLSQFFPAFCPMGKTIKSP